MIFVDTGAWFAASVPADIDHSAAARFLADNTESLLTTDFVVDEVLTLLRARGEAAKALAVGKYLLGRCSAAFRIRTGALRIV
jgi:predicted nucleic acid-binding protein